MAMRVAYLWGWCTALTLGVAYFSLSNQSLALIGTRAFGGPALDVLQEHGLVLLFVDASVAHFQQGLPYLLLGLSAGLALRALGAWRSRRRRRERQGVQRVVDRWGVITQMHGAPLEHEPNVGVWALPRARESSLPAGLSVIERDALALLSRHRDWPADLEGYHHASLATHAVNAWQEALAQHGTGSLPAMIALCHDLGKIRAFAKRADGSFERVSHHPSETMQVVRDLPGITQLPREQRDKFLDLLSAVVTGKVALDLTEDERAIVRAARRADFVSTASEHGQSHRNTLLDPAALAQLLQPDAIALVAELNVNQSKDASTAEQGCYVSAAQRLWLPLTVLHRQMLKILPPEIVLGLPLTVQQPARLEPSAVTLMAQLAATLFELEAVVDGKQAQGGMFQVRTGRRTWQAAVAIAAVQLPEALRNRWGTWKYEIDIL
jgi:hypothetical protein